MRGRPWPLQRAGPDQSAPSQNTHHDNSHNTSALFSHKYWLDIHETNGAMGSGYARILGFPSGLRRKRIEKTLWLALRQGLHLSSSLRPSDLSQWLLRPYPLLYIIRMNLWVVDLLPHY